ncbi:hypothetical protein C2G38_2200272 [Gigaspora rosea]|uniref:Uncharacterized protein n=1 Tax=Gigaspora rosea TaxID=44941 RepID=A0A397UT91_9GLOM|nr:hypothetical protein C2G38_2200272 [Gigaspora rosea]
MPQVVKQKKVVKQTAYSVMQKLEVVTYAKQHESKELGKQKPIWQDPSKEVAKIFDGATKTGILETRAGELDDMTFRGEGPPIWPPESYQRKRIYVIEVGTRGRKTMIAPNAG